MLRRIAHTDSCYHLALSEDQILAEETPCSREKKLVVGQAAVIHALHAQMALGIAAPDHSSLLEQMELGQQLPDYILPAKREPESVGLGHSFLLGQRALDLLPASEQQFFEMGHFRMVQVIVGRRLYSAKF